MIFKTVTSCPQDIDTVVSYMQYNDALDFSDTLLQESYDHAFGDDTLELSAGTIKSFRIRHAGKFINLLLVYLLAVLLMCISLCTVFLEPRVGKARVGKLEENLKSRRNCKHFFSPDWHSSCSSSRHAV